jgi:uncharacterized protein (TIGR02145 family)
MRRSLLFILAVITAVTISAQVPQKMSYQSVIRNNNNMLVINQAVKIRISILQGSASGTVVYTETHSATTNANGIVTIEIGGGTPVTGTFNSIDWSAGSHFIKTETDPAGGTNYTLTATSQLLSVPYAMVAGSLGSSVNKFTVSGTSTDMEEALFEVKNKEGQTVFAVYNEGVRIYVSDGAKGTKGGFAVGGYNSKAGTGDLLVVSPDSIRAYVAPGDGSKGVKGGFAVGAYGSAKADATDLLFVSPDSIRAYINTGTEAKAAKGGFAISGFAGAKGGGLEYLRVTDDSIRAYVEKPAAKGAKGGFAVGGYNTAKGSIEDFMLLNPDSTRFYVRETGNGGSSTFNIVGIGQDLKYKSLFIADKDTIGIAGVLNVQNDMKVLGNIDYTGTVNSIVPSIYTLEPFDVSDTSMTITADISSDGGKVIIVSGFVWDTLPEPKVTLATKTTNGTLTGQFTSTITGLLPGKTYYIRAYATNANGTGYGSTVMVTTLPPLVTVNDIDGNSYVIVAIGGQEWFASNLRTTRLNDGTAIPLVSTDANWTNLSGPGYTWYNDDPVSYTEYGPLYNWDVVNTGILCPAGWDVPSEADWSTLASNAGGVMVAGGKLKEAGTFHWAFPNTDATNEYGFRALPGGVRSYMGPSFGLGQDGYWWSSTMITVDPTSVSMSYFSGELMIMSSFAKAGHSVRCVRNLPVK